MNKEKIIKEIENRIIERSKKMDILSKDFSERDSIGNVWTKRNSAYAMAHSELAELSDLLRKINASPNKTEVSKN